MSRIRRRRLLLAASALLLAGSKAIAQQQPKIWRIGILETVSRTMNSANLDALQKGLRDRGYAEGQNLLIHYRSADGHPERFGELANELVSEKVDLILTRGTPATRAAMAATRTIPIVITAAGSPVRSGLVKSLARPGGNVTGLGALTADLSGRRLQLLKEIIPSLVRVGVLANMSNSANQFIWQEFERAARSLSIQADLFDIRKGEDLPNAFASMKEKHAGAAYVAPDGVTQQYRERIAELSLGNRLPVLGSSVDLGPGALVYYAVNIRNQYSRAASYVDKIFKGVKPGELPMEEPTVLELTVNLKTAKALGLTIPQSVLIRADRIIE